MLTTENYNSTDDNTCDIRFHKAELPIVLFCSFILNVVATINLTHLAKSMKSKNLWLLVSLAANDMFSSVTLMSAILANIFTCNMFKFNIFCEILGFFGITSFGLSFNLIGLISIERFLMVVFPIYHYTKLTIEKLFLGLAVCVILNMTLVALPLFNVGAPYIYYNDNKFCAFHWSAWGQKNETHATLVLFNGIYMAFLVIIVVFSNIATYIKLRKRARIFNGINFAASVGQNKANKFSLLIKVVAVVNCICTLPFSIKIIIDYSNKKNHIEGLEDSITSILLFLTPIINPFLYLIFNKAYRQNLLRPLRKLPAFKQCQTNKIAPQTVTMDTQV